MKDDSEIPLNLKNLLQDWQINKKGSRHKLLLVVFILENETENVDPAIINRLRGYYEQFYTHKFDNLLVNKMD